MNAGQSSIPNSQVKISLSILQRIFANYYPRNFAIRLWEGSSIEPDFGQKALFTMVINHPGALRKMFLQINELALGEAYIYNDFDIEGDMEAAFLMAEKLFEKPLSLSDKFYLWMQLMKLPAKGKQREERHSVQLKGKLHSRERDRQAVTFHYNVSNDFFALWLDPQMAYSCAYFNSWDEDLTIAQERKLDYICRKLRLHPGDRLLDIGCGWGGLIRHAAKKYGAKVLGITLSGPQALWANEHIEREGLTGQCRVEIRDYRDIDEAEGFDKIVSVGMFEHVGESKLPEYFEKAWRLLRPGGVFLNHGIASGLINIKKRGSQFADKYVFPDSQLLPVSTTVRVAEASGFEVRDVENLREHYMLTLRHWLKQLEAHHEEACSLTDEIIYRIWRLSHAGSAAGFQTGRLSVNQMLLVKPIQGESKLPLNRVDWYV